LDSTPRAYRLKVGNAAPTFLTEIGTTPDRKPARCRHPSEKQHVNVRSRPCKQAIGSASKQEHSNTIRQDSLLDDLLEGLQDLLVNSALPLFQPGADFFFIQFSEQAAHHSPRPD
jgi:hypothetical protein